MFRSHTRCAEESRTPLSYMTCPDENASIPSFEEIGQGRWLNRPEFHVPCLGMSLIIIILYLLELRVVLSYRKYSPFTSTFFRIWTVQAIADLLSLLCYIIAFVRNMPHTWGFWMKLNATPLPSILGTMNGAVVLSQMIGVCIISLNRYLKICKPTSKLTVKFDSISTFGFSLLILVFPTMTTALILFPGAPRYVYIMGQSYVIAACYQNPKMLQAFSGLASIMCIISLFISTICYGQVMQNIAVLNCVKRRSLKTEKTLTFLSISVYISLWFVFAYYSIGVISMFFRWKAMFDLLFAYYHLLNLSLAIANPISALFSEDIRRRVLFNDGAFSNKQHVILRS